MKLRSLLIILILIAYSGCVNQSARKKDTMSATNDSLLRYPLGTFGYDLELLNSHHEMILLSGSSGNSVVALSAEWQGRVMTSSFDGMDGASLGWINHELISSREIKPHINPFGGEDRFWLGPEGGQFSLFFKSGKPFDLSSWQVPEELDTKPFEIVSHSDSDAHFRKELKLINYSGFTFNLLVERQVRLLSETEIMKTLKTDLKGIKCVAFESQNRITNTGNNAWIESTGALSVWILGMFRASDHTTVVIPVKKGDDPGLGPRVTSYFNEIPPQRLIIHDGCVLFRGDGKFKCKIGISPKRALPYLGAYDDSSKVLTIVNIDLPENNLVYVNSLLEMQARPFSGDVYNSYNDGPADNGEQLGSYFELETSSPAAFLVPGHSISHTHRTIHVSGEIPDLDQICRNIFGIPLDEIKNAFE